MILRSSLLLLLLPAFSLILPLMLIGCGGPPKARTTFLNSVDLLAMTDQMAQSFTQDSIINARSAESEPWIISIYRIVNNTNQVIPEKQKWLYINRLRAMLDRSDVAQQRRLTWIIPPERWSIVAQETGEPEPYGLRLDPTHLLTAEFNALTNTSGMGRTDTYLCAYELVDLASGQIVWQDSWEVKRAAAGRTYD